MFTFVQVWWFQGLRISLWGVCAPESRDVASQGDLGRLVPGGFLHSIQRRGICRHWLLSPLTALRSPIPEGGEPESPSPEALRSSVVCSLHISGRGRWRWTEERASPGRRAEPLDGYMAGFGVRERGCGQVKLAGTFGPELR